MIQGARELHRIQTRSKGDRDLVSEVDLRAEQRIVEILSAGFPRHGIRSEEGGGREAADSPYQWLVDPLDGTHNFMHSNPSYCVSIALLNGSQIECGVVFDPVRGELFEATRGRGAKLNDRRLRITDCTSLDEALISTGFPPLNQSKAEAMGGLLSGLHCSVGGVRQSGSSALDLAYFAAGRFSGVVHFGLRPWDSAAGALLVQEAGGLVTDFAGGAQFLDSGEIVAAGPRLAPLLLAKISETHTAS